MQLRNFLQLTLCLVKFVSSQEDLSAAQHCFDIVLIVALHLVKVSQRLVQLVHVNFRERHVEMTGDGEFLELRLLFLCVWEGVVELQERSAYHLLAVAECREGVILFFEGSVSLGLEKLARL